MIQKKKISGIAEVFSVMTQGESVLSFDPIAWAAVEKVYID